MAHEHPHDHDAHGDTQAEQTAVTWQALLDNGARDGGPLVVDSYFYADDDASAHALADALAAAGSDVDVEPGRAAGRLRKAKPWAVVSTTNLSAASLPVLSALIGRMIGLAHTHGVEYDGWGAEVPEA